MNKISLEEYLGHRTDPWLERGVRVWLITHPEYNTDEHHTLVDTNENDNLFKSFKVPKKAIYSKEYLDACFSNENPNWQDGSLKRLVEECKEYGHSL